MASKIKEEATADIQAQDEQPYQDGTRDNAEDQNQSNGGKEEDDQALSLPENQNPTQYFTSADGRVID